MNSQDILDRIQIPLNEFQAAKRNSPGDQSEQEWYEASKHRLDIKSRDNNIRARKIFAWAIFGMICVWLASVLAIVVFTGLKTLILDKTVLIALITSGSINVIGLFTLVAKYLFHVHEDHEPAIEPKIENPSESQALDKPNTESLETPEARGLEKTLKNLSEKAADQEI